MARRVFLHIGTPEAGMTCLQNLWWQHRETLAERGMLLPGGSADAQLQAAAVVRADQGVLDTMGPDRRGAWDRLVAEVAEWDGDALISQAQLVEAPPDQILAALSGLRQAAREVHVVITVRDLVRQVPSAWEQRVKDGSATTLRRFFQRAAGDDPDVDFWLQQDVPRILERWGTGLPAAQVHVVPLPRPGAERDRLWRRMCDLLGIDDTGLSLAAPVADETLAPAEIAFHRLVNSQFPHAHLDVATSQRINAFMQPRLTSATRHDQSGRVARVALPVDMHGWLVERSNRMADELAAAPWHVVGDLDDLRPDPQPTDGVDPDAVPDSEAAAVAVAFIAAELRVRGGA